MRDKTRNCGSMFDNIFILWNKSCIVWVLKRRSSNNHTSPFCAMPHSVINHAFPYNCAYEREKKLATQPRPWGLERTGERSYHMVSDYL